MAIIYQLGDVITCPKCGAMQDDVVEDFIIPGKLNHPVIDLCYHCEQLISVTQINNKEFSVEKA